MGKSNSFKFTLRSDPDPKNPVIYLGEHRPSRSIFRMFRGGGVAREFAIREVDNAKVYRHFLELLREQGAPLNSLETLPTDVALGVRELSSGDPRKQIALGVDSTGSRVELDLISHPHGFIGGSAGCGKTTALETIFDQVVASERSELWIADGRPDDFGGYPLRVQDRYVNRPEDFSAMLQDLLVEAWARKKRLKDESKRSYLELENPPRAIFLGISEAVRFFGKQEGALESDEMLLEEIYPCFAELLKISPGFGIHIFVESARWGLPGSFEALIAKFPNRILMNRADSRTQALVLGEPSSYPSRLLEPRGRAVLAVRGTQHLFQGYRPSQKPLLDGIGNNSSSYS